MKKVIIAAIVVFGIGGVGLLILKSYAAQQKAQNCYQLYTAVGLPLEGDCRPERN